MKKLGKVALFTTPYVALCHIRLHESVELVCVSSSQHRRNFLLGNVRTQVARRIGSIFQDEGIWWKFGAMFWGQV
jgi:hypothetical protein